MMALLFTVAGAATAWITVVLIEVTLSDVYPVPEAVGGMARLPALVVGGVLGYRQSKGRLFSGSGPFLAFGVIVLVLLASAIVWPAIWHTEEEDWDIAFGGIAVQVNRDAIEPTKALIAVSACNTTVTCQTALDNLLAAWGPHRMQLSNSITALENLRVPTGRAALHQEYLGMLYLRLQAIDLYTQSIPDLDLDRINAADELYMRSQEAAMRVLDEWESIK